jgi:type IV fimbrial biogenesis protein FimT
LDWQCELLGTEERWVVLTKRYMAGFTLIELAVGLAIVSILLVLGMPTFNALLDSSRLKSAASGFSSGIQLARAQAISSNQQVNFIPALSGSDLSAGWSIWNTGGAQAIESKSAQESSGQMVLVAALDSTRAAVDVQSITFNGLGGAVFRDSAGAPVVINPVIFAFSSRSGACYLSNGTGGSIRCLDVRVTPAGQIRLCDPQVAAGDSRQC